MRRYRRLRSAVRSGLRLGRNEETASAIQRHADRGFRGVLTLICLFAGYKGAGCKLLGCAGLALATATLDQFDDLLQAEGNDQAKGKRDDVHEHGLAAKHERYAT